MMSNYVFGGLIVLIIFFTLRFFYRARRRRKKIDAIKKAWGSPKSGEHFNFHAISRYFENTDSRKEAFHIISDNIKHDLDLDELFKFIDRTSSKIGQQYLYYKLRTVGSLDELMKFDALTRFFEEKEELRLNCQFNLARLNKSDAYDLEELINGGQIQKPKMSWLVYLLAVVNVGLIVLGFFNSLFFLFLFPTILINAFFHFRNKRNIQYYASGINQLGISLKVAKSISKSAELRTHFESFKFIASINAIRFRTQFIGIEKNLDNEFAFVVTYFVELIKILFNIEYILFFSFIDAITKRKEEIEALYTFIGKTDAAISVAALKAGDLQVCQPKFVKEKRIFTQELIHPLVDNCVSNDLELSGHSMLLTGSNMSGKSTFIRAVAINSLLAQTLNVCFSKKYEAPYLKLYTSIRVADDLLSDKSYYLEEVLRIKELIEAAESKGPKLFVLDEIFKGTNTVERISSAKGVLTYLNKKENIVFVSTHDIELTELMKNYELFHFNEAIQDGQLHFDHKVKKGRLKTRNAIQILELYGYPDEILSDSRETEKTYFSE